MWESKGFSENGVTDTHHAADFWDRLIALIAYVFGTYGSSSDIRGNMEWVGTSSAGMVEKPGFTRLIGGELHFGTSGRRNEAVD